MIDCLDTDILPLKQLTSYNSGNMEQKVKKKKKKNRSKALLRNTAFLILGNRGINNLSLLCCKKPYVYFVWRLTDRAPKHIKNSEQPEKSWVR